MRTVRDIDVIRSMIVDYHVIENLKIKYCKKFFADSAILYPFLKSNRGAEWLKTSQGQIYMETLEGTKFINEYYGGKKLSPNCCSPFENTHRYFGKTYEEEDNVYINMKKLLS